MIETKTEGLGSGWKLLVLILSPLTVFVTISLWLVFYAPPNMDEFVSYHRIACSAFPNAVEHVFRESCSAYPTRIFGLDFYRNYWYIGISSNVLYWPFYKIYSSPTSHYAVGFLALLLFSLLLVRAFSLSKLTFVLPLVYFPLLFQIFHDTGPIRIGLVSFPLIIILAINLFSPMTPTYKRTLLLVALFLILSIAIDDKPFYVYLIPQLMLLSLGSAFFRWNRDSFTIFTTQENIHLSAKRSVFFSFMLFFGAVFLSLVFSLFLTEAPIGSVDRFVPYLMTLLMVKDASISFFQELSLIAQYFISPILFAHRIYDLSPGEIWLSIFCFAPSLVLVLLFLLEKKGHNRVILMACFGLQVIIFLLTRNANAGHHFIYLHIPILIALMIYANSSRTRFAMVALALSFSSVVSWGQLFFAKEYVHSEKGREAVFSYLSQSAVASDAIINFTSWGGYYQQSLYGAHSQLVTYIEPMNRGSAERLSGLWIKTGRKFLLNVCVKCSESDFRIYFPNSKIDTIEFPTTSWRIIRIEK